MRSPSTGRRSPSNGRTRGAVPPERAANRTTAGPPDEARRSVDGRPVGAWSPDRVNWTSTGRCSPAVAQGRADGLVRDVSCPEAVGRTSGPVAGVVRLDRTGRAEAPPLAVADGRADGTALDVPPPAPVPPSRRPETVPETPGAADRSP
ncbi:protein of unknown function (plasmid) [Streptantibioticus cattleyicolor NRRL 8057 = DSM 46488]|nr:protein of unknown function [Streptantibioticus cattleyicolor NRRL 8057 = DSM 46488]